ncbi:hypothetical protein HQ571_01895 [Candidatus Kuenenbacteria bacterium]|nr:hypothetical protein [Candidatus Kuenenbacteria bacterium]
MLKALDNLYHNVRNTLVWLVVYFALQVVLWVALAVLILIYPQALFILFSVFFVLLAALNVYLALIALKYSLRLKKLKDKLIFKNR